MAGDIQEAGTAEETGQPAESAVQPAAETKPTIDSIVDKRVNESEAKASGTEETHEEPVQAEKKESKGERIQRLYREEKERNESLQVTVITLQEEIKGIKERLASGDITKQQAGIEIAEAKDDFSKALEGVELSPDLMPYKDDLFKFFDHLAGPLKQQISTLLEEKARSDSDRAKSFQEGFEKTVTETYTKRAEEYPHLFVKGKVGDSPKLKPEFEEEAMAILAKYNRPSYDRQGNAIKDKDGNPVFFNTLIDVDNPETVEAAFDFIFSNISRKFDKAERAKLDAEKLERVKRGQVEQPGLGSTTKPKSLDAIIDKHMKAMR